MSYVMADSFEEAVEKCIEAAKSGDAVLLSPACASWGCLKTMRNVEINSKNL